MSEAFQKVLDSMNREADQVHPLPKLLNDVSRCFGVIDLRPGAIPCPQRKTCKRYLTTLQFGDVNARTVFVLVSGKDQVGNCDSFLEHWVEE
jgi:hypothetical protein